MGKKSRRSTKKRSHIFKKVFAPVRFVLNSSAKVAKKVGHGTGNVVQKGFHGVRKIGSSVAKGANNIVNKVTRRRRRH